MERTWCRCLGRFNAFMFLLLSASPGLAQKVEWRSHARLGLGQTYEKLSGISSLGTAPDEESTMSDSLERERKFYLTNIGGLHSHATVQSDWTNSAELERGQAWDEDSGFTRGSFNSSFEFRELKDRYKLGLSVTQNKGDLNYRRPPLVELPENEDFPSTLSSYYEIQTGYSHSLDAFSSLNLGVQASLYRQGASDIRTQRVEFRY